MVVQISGLNQLCGPTVEIGQSRLRRFSGLNRVAQPSVAVKSGQILPQPRRIAVPNTRPLFQPTFKITTPNDLIYEFGGGFGPLRFNRCGNDLLLRQKPASDVGRQH